MKLEGVILYYDKENGNNRIYTRECAENIIEQFREMGLGNCLGEPGQGELDHPDIKLTQLSHKVNELWIDEDSKTLKCKLELLEGTPKGVLLKETIQACGIENFSIASRGTGTVNKYGEVENYELISFDVIPKEKSSTKGPIKITDL